MSAPTRARAARPADLLRFTELFGGLDQRTAAQVADRTVMRSYDRGAALFHQGDPGDAVFVLVSGSVAVVVTGAAGSRMVLRTLRPPAVLGEIALLDGGPRSASAEALERTHALVLARSAFLDLVRGPAITDQVFRSLGALVRRLSEQAADFVFLDLSGRTAKALLQLANSAGVVTVTQSRLAEIAGGARQSVNQILQAFQAEGLVVVDGRRTVLRDVPALRAHAGLAPRDAD